MDEETRRYVEEWKEALERADRYARFYLTLRVGALTFTILAVGALLAFGWNAGFRHAFECTTFYQKLLRGLIILLNGVVGVVYLPLEQEFNRRYRLSWQKGRFYEMALGDFGGLHTQIKGMVTIREPQSFPGRFFNRIFSLLVQPHSSLRGVIGGQPAK